MGAGRGWIGGYCRHHHWLFFLHRHPHARAATVLEPEQRLSPHLTRHPGPQEALSIGGDDAVLSMPLGAASQAVGVGMEN
jgi:hypothetical protein